MILCSTWAGQRRAGNAIERRHGFRVRISWNKLSRRNSEHVEGNNASQFFSTAKLRPHPRRNGKILPYALLAILVRVPPRFTESTLFQSIDARGLRFSARGIAKATTNLPASSCGPKLRREELPVFDSFTNSIDPVVGTNKWTRRQESDVARDGAHGQGRHSH